MAKSTKPNVATGVVPQKKTAKKNKTEKVAFTPLSDAQLAHFKQKLLQMKAEQEEDALGACRLALMEVEEVDHTNIQVGNIPSLYKRHCRHFDKSEKKIVEYYLNIFCVKVSEALGRIEHKTYGKCVLTGTNIAIDRLETYPLATESVVNGEKPKQVKNLTPHLAEVPINKDGSYDPRHLRQATIPK